MRICIILPRFNKSPFIYNENETENNYNYMMPLGLPYISATLKKNEFDVDVLNLNHYIGTIKDIFEKEFTANKYDIVFTGGLSIYYPNIKDYIKYIRKTSPNTKIVVGGGIITAQPEIMFDLLKPDYIVVGEGENTSVELTRCIKNSGDIQLVNGIGYDDNHKFILTKPREPINNLDILPIPDLESFGFNDYLNHMMPANYILLDTFDTPRMYPLLMSRSCPFNCTFCFHPVGQKYRQRSIDNIMEEIKFVVNKYNINLFMCYDELLSHDRDRILEFCMKFNEFRKTNPWDIKWNCALRVDDIDEELIKIMKNSGCTLISFGLESYSNKVLRNMNKHITSEQIDKALRVVSDNNIAIQGTFIFGDPSETLETAKETLDYFENNQNILRGGVQLGFIVLFQGSPLYKYCITKGKIKDEIEFIVDRSKKGYTFYEPINLTDTLSDKEFQKLKNDIMVSIYTSGYNIVPLTIDTQGVHIKCPYCNKISILKNINPTIGWNNRQNIGCRHCNGRFEMVSKYYIIYIIILKTIGFYNLIKILNAISFIKKLNPFKNIH